MKEPRIKANRETGSARIGSRPKNESRRSTHVPDPRSGSIDPGSRNTAAIPNLATMVWLLDLLSTRLNPRTSFCVILMEKSDEKQQIVLFRIM
jgi:hypothetical protein